MRGQKLLSLVVSIFFIFGLWAPNEGNNTDFNIKKSSNPLKDENKIEYRIEYSKENFNEALNPYVLDRVDNDLNLTNLSFPLPSRYEIKGKIYEGTPLKEDYKEVDSLYWNVKSFAQEEERRLRYNQTYPNFGYSYNSSFRTDLLYFPSSKIYERISSSKLSLGDIAPILELVERDVRLFLGTLDGRFLSMDPKSGGIYWEHKFPLGEGVSTPFASFREEIKKGEFRSYIVVLTEVGKLYLFDCLDGSIIWSRVIANNPLKRKGLIKILELSNRILISILFEDYLIVLDSKMGEEILRIKLPFSASSLIFFSLKGEPRLICSGEEGIVQCFSVDGSILWSKTLNGKINYEGTLAIFDGIPYLLFATSSKALYVLDSFKGEVLDIFTLPGLPRSSISFDSEVLFYFLLTSEGSSDSGKSFLYGRSLIKNSLQKETKVEIEGKSFIGPVGMRIKDETVLYFVNERGFLYVVQKGARKPISNYPIRLVSDNEIQTADSLKGYIVLTEGALFITANNFGFIIIGFPFTLSEKSYLSSFSYLGSEDLSAKTVNFSGARFRNDLDSLPSLKINLKKPLNISPYDNSGHIITPIVYFDKLAGELRIISVSANGKLIVMNENGEEIESINPGIGPIYTEPVITFDEKGNRTTYLMGLNGVVSLCKSISITEKWRRADLGSCGSSAALLETNLGERLIFVDKLNYLTSLNTSNGETIFREKVDCRDFALNEVDGEKFIFCGSKMINAKNGLVVKNSFIKGSSSTAEGIGGRLLLFQSDDLDMLCIDPKNDGLVWRVRKLWCKKYCFDGQSPAILRKGSWALSFWCDYMRIVCVEVDSGFIRWSFSANDDFFVSKPTVVETLDGAYVFADSINGKVYAFDCFTGRPLPDYPIQLPGKAINLEVLKGASSPVIVNGLLLVNRVEYGLIGIGKSRETNRLSATISFKVEIKENRRGKIIFNQAILYWDNKYKKSNTVKN